MTREPGSPTSDGTCADGNPVDQVPVDAAEGGGPEDIESQVSSDGLLVESGVFPQLLGLSTGTEEARPQPSPHALWLLIAPAVYLTIDALVDHGRHCHRSATCPHIPPPLRLYAKMRKEALEGHT